MEWPTDGHKLSIHHLQYIVSPLKSWNEYLTGDTGVAKYPNNKGEDWPFIICDVGRKYRYGVHHHNVECTYRMGCES
jgi:hypothetical protein